MTGPPLLEVVEVTRRFGGLAANDAVSLALDPGSLHAVIGPNGAGKSTLLAQIAGTLRPDTGRIRLGGRDITRLSPRRRARLGLARGFQISSVLPRFSALENVALAVQARRGLGLAGLLVDAARDRSLNRPAVAALAEVGLADQAAVPAGALSHGARRRLELAICLAQTPRLLLLDEPVAGMGPDESRATVDLLARIAGGADDRPAPAILLIEHDMDAVFALADRVTVLVQGRVLASGPAAEVRADAAVRTAYLGTAAAPP